MNTPDPKWHFRISIVKSGLRIGASFQLIKGNLVTAGALFIVAEALGVLEEII